MRGGMRVNVLQAQATCQGHFTGQVGQRLLLGLLEVSSSEHHGLNAPLTFGVSRTELCLRRRCFSGVPSLV